MSKTIVIVGFGPGVSTAVADRFGAAGFAVALIARSEKRLAAAVAMLTAKGISAAAFRADAGDPVAVRAAIAQARAALGPVSVLHWNAFGGAEVAARRQLGGGNFRELEPAPGRYVREKCG